jgi:hypothetical protein
MATGAAGTACAELDAGLGAAVVEEAVKRVIDVLLAGVAGLLVLPQAATMTKTIASMLNYPTKPRSTLFFPAEKDIAGPGPGTGATGWFTTGYVPLAVGAVDERNGEELGVVVACYAAECEVVGPGVRVGREHVLSVPQRCIYAGA